MEESAVKLDFARSACVKGPCILSCRFAVIISIECNSGLQEAKNLAVPRGLGPEKMKLGSILIISFLREAVAYKPLLSSQRESHQHVRLVRQPQIIIC